MLITNVELSKTEMDLVSSAEFILTKNRIIEKVYELFGTLSEDYKKIIAGYSNLLPAEALKSSPKIYKGESYKSLPYVMLDYPRIFLKENIFAVRSFFWWGNYFSVTLQLSGTYLGKFKKDLIYNLNIIKGNDLFICVNASAWEHHFEADNYKPLNEIENLGLILNKAFIKIAAKLPLHEWNHATVFFNKNYSNLIGLITQAMK